VASLAARTTTPKEQVEFVYSGHEMDAGKTPAPPTHQPAISLSAKNHSY
jgi:hypothetical protein